MFSYPYRKYRAKKGIDLKDPQLACAAVKIQSVYKGFKTRKVRTFLQNYSYNECFALYFGVLYYR